MYKDLEREHQIHVSHDLENTHELCQVRMSLLVKSFHEHDIAYSI